MARIEGMTVDLPGVGIGEPSTESNAASIAFRDNPPGISQVTCRQDRSDGDVNRWVPNYTASTIFPKCALDSIIRCAAAASSRGRTWCMSGSMRPCSNSGTTVSLEFPL